MILNLFIKSVVYFYNFKSKIINKSILLNSIINDIRVSFLHKDMVTGHI